MRVIECTPHEWIAIQPAGLRAADLLTPTQRDLLVAARDLGATDEDHSQPRSAICKAAGHADPTRAWSGLVDLKLMIGGRGKEGSWLSDLGCQVAEPCLGKV